MKRPLFCYIAGPLTADTPEVMEANARRAMRWMADLICHGHVPFCPHLSLYVERMLEADEGAGLEYEQWMQYDAAWLAKCDVLLYLGSSPGADRELEMARDLKMPVLYVDRIAEEQAWQLLRLTADLYR